MRVIIIASVRKSALQSAYVGRGTAQALIGAGIAKDVLWAYSDIASYPDGKPAGHAFTYTVDLEDDGSYRRATAVIEAIVHAATGDVPRARVWAVTSDGPVAV